MMDDDYVSFPSPYDTVNPQKRKTAVGLRIMAASQLIREKKRWRKNLTVDAMIENWKEEAIGNGLKPIKFTAVLDQLKYIDSLATDSIEVGAVDGTRIADNLIPKKLKNEFVEVVNAILDESDKSKKNYEPGTANLVVNLLDPSLYCSVSGVTYVTDFDLDMENCLLNIGKGKREAAQRKRYTCGPVPVVYQLLPAEFHVDETGQVKINSYINNLHPTIGAELYSLIERVFTCFVPLFNGVLYDLLGESPDEVLKNHKKQKLEGSSNKTYLHGRDVQVIVRMKSIELTPKKFGGGDWHIEGEENEHIISTGIYCFHSENITESRLYFRQLRGQNQEMGSIATPENRLLAFPNICQHRIGSFKLKDETKPGFRKILVFFLVDPTIRITSTRNVPPQQMKWFEQELLKIPPFDRLGETVCHITRFLEWPLMTKKAMTFRNELIKTRKEFKNVQKELKIPRKD